MERCNFTHDARALGILVGLETRQADSGSAMSMCNPNYGVVFIGDSGSPEIVRVRRFGHETDLHEQWMARSDSEL